MPRDDDDDDRLADEPKKKGKLWSLLRTVSSAAKGRTLVWVPPFFPPIRDN